MKSPKTTNWLQRNSLILMSTGLFLASSGLDGSYMASMMPEGLGWMGFIMNTTGDVITLGLSYWYGRFRMDRSSVKRKKALVLLGAEVISCGYSWLFSWRMLLQTMTRIEGTAAVWLAPLAAAFVPLLLAFVGYAAALRAGRVESTTEERVERKKARYTCDRCGKGFDKQRAYAGHRRHCSGDNGSSNGRERVSVVAGQLA